MPATNIKTPRSHPTSDGTLELQTIERPRVELIDTSLSGTYYLKRDSRAWASAFRGVGFDVVLHARQKGASDMRKTVHGSDVVLCEGLFKRNSACMRPYVIRLHANRSSFAS